MSADALLREHPRRGIGVKLRALLQAPKERDVIAQGETLGPRLVPIITIALKGQNRKRMSPRWGFVVLKCSLIPGRCPSLSYSSPLGTGTIL